jgi:hypothetical protein
MQLARMRKLFPVPAGVHLFIAWIARELDAQMSIFYYLPAKNSTLNDHFEVIESVIGVRKISLTRTPSHSAELINSPFVLIPAEPESH